ncbi:MAG: GNAT family N-acetyltransferase [Candidatus Thorarchaeota archaeon]|nr:GNAT family N-acetyltransferase [Candidatus Thorarchaeota archaeon]
MPSIIRRCSEQDVDKILQLAAYAYSIPESSFERYNEILAESYNEYYLHEVDGVPIATARVLSLEQNIRGAFKPMAGIGMVASAPEYRRKGYVRDLMLRILQDLKQDNYALSTLYPFKDTFYAALGYVKMPPTQTLTLNPANLAGIACPRGYMALREEGEKAGKAWRSVHEKSIHSIHGGALRNDAQWKQKLDKIRSKVAVARNEKGEAEGVMLYTIKGYGEGHGWAETGTMSISEIHWSTLEGRDALLRFIYLHADQIVKVSLTASSRMGDYYHWLSDLHTITATTNIVTMARIVNIPAAFNGLTVEDEKSEIIKVQDNLLSWNNGVFSFKGSNGMILAEPSKEDATTAISIEGLTSILYGTLGEESLRRIGYLKGRTPATLFNWFSRETPWLTESF